ncbi:hypothetical protein K0B04_00925 [Patescibacteria group bacterium]|nr:hypothetical protein [Patescibacteria group bacterium]
MIDLTIKQDWLEKSNDSALEEFKSFLVEVLNHSPQDRFAEKRWSITKTFENNISHLFYDEHVLAMLQVVDGKLLFNTENKDIQREEDVLYAVRFVSEKLSLAVYSNAHKGARLPQKSILSLDNPYFEKSKVMNEFFLKTNFIPRYCNVGIETLKDGTTASIVYPPYFAEDKTDGSMHILNNFMIDFLINKENQTLNREFSYKVAESMNDFAKKYDLNLVPMDFYQNYGVGTKIINNTFFDVYNIKRKVFINPYVWNFDEDRDYTYYKNVNNGMHLMDKVRKGENLDTALKRVLRDELKVAEDYVGAIIWGMEFDRDREGFLTPRLNINIFVHGLLEKQRHQDYDWVSIK